MAPQGFFLGTLLLKKIIGNIRRVFSNGRQTSGGKMKFNSPLRYSDLGGRPFLIDEEGKLKQRPQIQ